MSVAWKRNETNGEANFDIDEDYKKGQLSFFGEKSLTKIEEFKQKVKEKILNKEIVNNFELLDFVYNEGHIGKHASEVLKEMKKNGEIKYEGNSPLVTYKNVYQNKNKIEYKI